MQQHPADTFYRPRPIHGMVRVNQTPPASSISRTSASTTLTSPPLRIDQRSQVIKSIRRYQTSGNKLPQGVFDLGLKKTNTPGYVLEKTSTALLQEFVHSLRCVAQHGKI